MELVKKKFYNLFWTDPICQDIFSKHKSQLLENEVELIVTREKFYARRIVLTNSQRRKSEKRLVKRNESENIELLHNLQTAAVRYFSGERMESYIMHRFGETIGKIEGDLKKTGGWFKLLTKLVSSLDDEKDLFKLLSDYKLIPEGISSKELFFKYFEEEFNQQIKKFLKKENLSDLAISIDLISTYYNHKIKNNLFSATKHFTDILYDTDNFNDRLQFFDTLYEMDVIKGGRLKSYYECVNCPPNTFNGVLTIDIKPTSLKLKCPCCKKDLYYIVPFELDQGVYEDIVHPDGLLFFAIGHLLDQYGWKYIANYVQPPDIELDYCILNEENLISEIIEVKMFKMDRPEDTLVGNIRTAVSQIKKSIDKLVSINPGFKMIQKSLVTNVSSDHLYKLAKTEMANDLKEYNILIYTAADFYAKIKK